MMDNKEVVKYREGLLAELRSASQAFAAACRAVSDPYVMHETEGWTVHQLASHTRDVQVHVYGERIRRTFNENHPHFGNFDADEWMATHYQRNEAMDTVLEAFENNVKELMGMLESAPQEAWSRTGRHETQGERTLQAWVERCLAHIQEHLNTIKRL